ncbi:hypothetical protein [Aeromonas caviae]|uniref:hypothetical protein n=1 Tax=Aeromonas caviae TaxID=648 RepID=UPI002B4714CA|nr:hypothetical protein [Aeromonas caviae]
MLFLSIFFATLANHSGATIYISLFFLIAHVALSGRLRELIKLPIKSYFIAFLFVIVSALLFLFGIPEYQPAQEFVDAFSANFAKYILLILLVYFYAHVYNTFREKFINTVHYVLLFHVALFSIQFVVAYGTGYYIDYVAPFTGEVSRYKIYGVESIDGLYRCTGFYIEPSTYAVSIFSLSVILISSDFDRYKKSIIISSISILMSLSTISFLIVILYWGLYFIRRYFSVKYLPIVLIGVPLLLFLVSQSNLYKIQIEKATNTSGIRFALLDAVLERPPSLMIMGSGLYAIERTITDGSKGSCMEGSDCSTQINRKYASPSDSGLLVYLFIKFGIFSMPILLYIILPFISDYSKMSGVFVILLTKIQFAFPLIWLVVIVFRAKNEKNHRNHKLAS